ncbi:hypothetical protein Tco_1345527, partial [Tanacetum coccineum]
MGKVKEVSTIPNLYIILLKEGFSSVNLTYLGGLWVLIELDSLASKENSHNHVGVGYWSKVYCIRDKELDAWTLKFLVDNLDNSSSDDESIDADEGRKYGDKEHENIKENSEVNRVSESSCMHGNEFMHENVANIHCKETIQSKDPFNIYEILRKNKDNVSRSKYVDQSYPPETKMESTNLFSIKVSWGNLTFDHVVSSSVGNSRGVFNEVRTEQEIFGSMFNIQGAMASLIELPLGGLMTLFPYVTGLCPDRHLSGHCPILIRESFLDYGPTPFCMFHSWFNMEGTDNANISRERSKSDKHGHGKGIECARSGRMLSKSLTSPSALIGQNPQGECHADARKHTKMQDFTLNPSLKKHNGSDTRNATLAIRVLTKVIQRLIIAQMDFNDLKGVSGSVALTI